jgi:hypothetical protein
MQNAGQPSAALCGFLRHAHPWCHQCSPVLITSVILSDTCLSHRGNDLGAVLSPTLRKFIFSSLVDSTHPCFSTFVLRLGMRLRLGHRIPCSSKRVCYRSLRFRSYLFAAASPPWPIVSTHWLPLLVPRLTHAHRPARLAALSGAVYSAHSQIPTPSTSALTGCESQRRFHLPRASRGAVFLSSAISRPVHLDSLATPPRAGFALACIRNLSFPLVHSSILPLLTRLVALSVTVPWS